MNIRLRAENYQPLCGLCSRPLYPKHFPTPLLSYISVLQTRDW